MNRLSLVASALSLCASSGFAEGNSTTANSITLYGLIDTGLTFVNNSVTGFAGGSPPKGAVQWTPQSGVLQGSRWGLRGTENLGADLSAVFTLENGFDLSTGKATQSGRLLGRQAFVGLQARAATMTLGRQYDPMVQFVSPQSAAFQWAGLYGAHWGNLDNMTPWSRNNNSIRLTTASMSGLTLAAIYSFGNQSGNFSKGNAWGAGAGYTNGPFRLGIAYTLAHDPYSAGANGNDPAISDPGSLALNADYPYANLLKTQQHNNFGISGGYRSGDLTVGLVYTKVRLLASQIVSAAGNNVSFDNYEINAAYHLTPTVLLGAEYAYTLGRVSGGKSGGGDLRPGFHQITLVADYLPSKRTDAYLLGAWQRAVGDGIGTFSGEGAPGAFAQINTLSPSGTNTQLAIRIGLRHTF